MEGLRFVFSTRSKCPEVLKPDGTPLFGEGYEFQPGVDDVILTGSAGYIISFGDALYRCVTRARARLLCGLLSTNIARAPSFASERPPSGDGVANPFP